MDVPITEQSIEPLLSVIVPLTKMSGRMDNLIEWLSESAELPIQIILVHDIQDSSTETELREVVAKYPRLDIQSIEGTFGSPGLARNAGLALALAPWTSFWDADDLPRPLAVVKAIEAANNQTEVIVGDFSINSGENETVCRHQNQIENIAMNPGLWRMIFRSPILSNLSFCDTRMGEDQLFLVDLNLGSRELCFSDEILYKYFQGHPMQLTSNQETVNEVSETLKLVRVRLRQNKNLRNRFSEIVVIKLLGTSILRVKGVNKFRSVTRNLDILVVCNPINLFQYILIASKSKRLKL